MALAFGSGDEESPPSNGNDPSEQSPRPAEKGGSPAGSPEGTDGRRDPGSSLPTPPGSGIVRPPREGTGGAGDPVAARGGQAETPPRGTPDAGPGGGGEADRPADDVEEFYDAVGLGGVRAVGGTDRRVGEKIEVSYRVENRTNIEFRARLFDRDRSTYHAGTLQHWIERLGDDSAIPAVPARVARDGRRYGVSGRIFATLATIGAAARFEQRVSVDTTDYPAGRYRLDIEFREADSARVVRRESIEFDLGP
ncbi:MAG: hypothetical protein HY720_12200 [Planctomycetes bacterium]|nr:hypothetical protein [Planctomycetota bacterium]